MSDATSLSTLPSRFVVAATASEAAGLLTSMGRVLVGLSADGVTHERLGIVERVTTTDGRIVLSGAAQDCSIAADVIDRVVADRTGGMKGRVLPRLEFRSAGNKVLLSVTSLDGLELFDAAIAAHVGEIEEPQPRPAAPEAAENPPGPDVGTEALNALRDSGGEIEVSIVVGPANQRWCGRIEEIRPMMGFANIIRPDFHLHLRDFSVGTLRQSGDAWEALDVAGAPSGLTFRPLDDAAREALAKAG